MDIGVFTSIGIKRNWVISALWEQTGLNMISVSKACFFVISE